MNASDELILKLSIEIVNENSGGIKFLELFLAIVEKVSDIEEVKITGDYLSENLERVIFNSKELKILKYTWNSIREKMFVYTP